MNRCYHSRWVASLVLLFLSWSWIFALWSQDTKILITENYQEIMVNWDYFALRVAYTILWSLCLKANFIKMIWVGMIFRLIIVGHMVWPCSCVSPNTPYVYRCLEDMRFRWETYAFRVSLLKLYTLLNPQYFLE